MAHTYYLWFLLVLFAGGTPLAAQTTQAGTVRMGDIDRTYRLYVPAGYNGLEPIPLMFNLHGHDSDGILQEFFSEMNLVADTAGFMVVYPDAFDGNWSVGFTGADYKWVDDIGFLSMLLDSIQDAYHIDPARVYATGFGQGALMSFRLACEMDDRIAGIGAITGTMSVDMESYCTGSRPMPVVHLHGDLDEVKAYIFAGELPVFSLDSVVNFWEDCYQCYDQGQVPMGSTDAAPQWPITDLPSSEGRVDTYPPDQDDIHPSQVIWEFLLDFKHPSPVRDPLPRWTEGPRIKTYPEPFSEILHLEGVPVGADIKVFDIEWRLVYDKVAEGQEKSLLTKAWQEGTYWMQINHAGSSEIRRIMKDAQ